MAVKTASHNVSAVLAGLHVHKDTESCNKYKAHFVYEGCMQPLCMHTATKALATYTAATEGVAAP